MIITNKYNYMGEDITDKNILFKDRSFGWVDTDGIPHIEWAKEDDICDKDGFDKRFRPDSNSDKYVIENYIIPRGTIICRYGNPMGRFTTIGRYYRNSHV